MPLIPLISIIIEPSGGGFAAPMLSFVDSTGLNPLPPGVIVTLSASGITIGSVMLQAGGIAPIVAANGTFTATFSGTQAPTVPVTFTAAAFGPTVVKVPNYQSPVYSAQGYAVESALHLPNLWFLDASGA